MHRKLNRSLLLDPRIRFIDEPPGTPGGGAPTPTPGAPAPTPTDPPKTEEPKTFTQEELTRVAAREKAEGKRAAEQAVADQLGVPLSEAVEILKKHREADDANKSEAQRDRDAAAQAKKDADAEKIAAQAETHQARLERAFSKEGLDLDGTSDEDKAKAARVLRMVSTEPGTSYEDVLAEVKSIKADFPGLFGTTGTPEPRRAPNGDPIGTPPKPTGENDKMAAGAERAKNRRRRGYDPTKPEPQKTS